MSEEEKNFAPRFARIIGKRCHFLIFLLWLNSSNLEIWILLFLASSFFKKNPINFDDGFSFFYSRCLCFCAFKNDMKEFFFFLCFFVFKSTRNAEKNTKRKRSSVGRRLRLLNTTSRKLEPKLSIWNRFLFLWLLNHRTSWKQLILVKIVIYQKIFLKVFYDGRSCCYKNGIEKKVKMRVTLESMIDFLMGFSTFSSKNLEGEI